jgi:hypothetical protein
MYGISPILSKVSNILVFELQKEFKEKGKLDQLDIKLSSYVLPDFNIDSLLIINSEFNAYDHLNSGLNSKSGKYQAIIKLNLGNLYMDSILHELKHAYVDWMIYKNGGTKIKDTREVKEFYTKDLERLLLNHRSEFPNLIKLVELYYYSSYLEVPSFLENYYFDKNYIDYKSKAVEMINLSDSDFKKSELEIEFNKLKDFNIPFFNRFKTFNSFLDKSKRILNKRGLKILKKLNRLDYQMLKSVNF